VSHTLHSLWPRRDAEGQTPFMLAVNCRAYQAALILFDTIKRVANRDCVNFTYQPSAPAAHTTVPFYDNVESTVATAITTPTTSTTTAFTSDPVNVTNTEEKLTKVMNAWFSKDCVQPTTTAPTTVTSVPTQTTSTAPVITPLHPQTSSPTSLAKRSTDVDWLYSYSQPPAASSGFSPAPQNFENASKSGRI